jgi:hypothetical protein
MSSTVTTYSSNINTNYPYPGVDNDTQGFRDNFSNIKNAVNAAAGEIDFLMQNTVKKGYNVNTSTIYGDYEIDINDGVYQKLQINSSSTATITFINWPEIDRYGAVKLEVVNVNTSYRGVFAFGGVKKETASSSTYILSTATSTTQTIFFDVWSPDSGSTTFLKYLGGPFV